MWLGLGLLHEAEGDWTTARDAYRAALEVRSGGPFVVFRYEDAYL